MVDIGKLQSKPYSARTGPKPTRWHATLLGVSGADRNAFQQQFLRPSLHEIMQNLLKQSTSEVGRLTRPGQTASRTATTKATRKTHTHKSSMSSPNRSSSVGSILFATNFPSANLATSSRDSGGAMARKKGLDSRLDFLRAALCAGRNRHGEGVRA